MMSTELRERRHEWVGSVLLFKFCKQPRFEQAHQKYTLSCTSSTQVIAGAIRIPDVIKSVAITTRYQEHVQNIWGNILGSFRNAIAAKLSCIFILSSFVKWFSRKKFRNNFLDSVQTTDSSNIRLNLNMVAKRTPT